jgi:high-affinity iron transporter
MLAFRSLLSSSGKADEVLERKRNIDLYLEGLDFDGATSNNFWFSLFATLSILIREGLEALLIIVAILSALRAMKANEAIKYVHVGWISALLLGIASYLLVEKVLELGAYNREIIEGLGAILAVIILLSVGYWLHDKSNAQRWQQYVKWKIQKNLNKGSFIGIGLLAFVVVFREAFESVVFLSALTAGGEAAAKNGVAFGFIISLILIVVLAVMIIKFSKTIPVHHVFKASSILIIVLAIILAGKGIKELQEAGWFGVNLLPFKFNIDFLGFYPTFQTVGAQLLVFIIAMILMQINKRKLA